MLDNYLLLDFLACLKFNLAGSASAAHNVYVASFGSGHALSLEVIEDFIGGLGGIGSDSVDRGGSVVTETIIVLASGKDSENVLL